MKQINSFLTQLQGYVNLGVISIKTKVARGIRFNLNKIIVFGILKFQHLLFLSALKKTFQ